MSDLIYGIKNLPVRKDVLLLLTRMRELARAVTYNVMTRANRIYILIIEIRRFLFRDFFFVVFP